ncbi:MAG TPA: transglutaminase [Methanocorpusculum sp.]|nr:transglutaminase [Methanocorpusculum sp.]
MLLDTFLTESEYIDFTHPAVEAKADELFSGLDELEKIRTAYYFVRDEIPHTLDIFGHIFPAKASGVLAAETGICHAKANLLAALLRHEKIPCGFCFEKITLAEDDRLGHCIHGYNAVFYDGKWMFLDARGNKPGVYAEFSTDAPSLAYPPREKYGEYIIDGIFAFPEPQVMKLLNRTKSIADLMKHFPDTVSIEPEIKKVIPF